MSFTFLSYMTMSRNREGSQEILDVPKYTSQFYLSDLSLYVKCSSQKSAMITLSKPSFKFIFELMLQIGEHPPL